MKLRHNSHPAAHHRNRMSIVSILVKCDPVIMYNSCVPRHAYGRQHAPSRLFTGVIYFAIVSPTIDKISHYPITEHIRFYHQEILRSRIESSNNASLLISMLNIQHYSMDWSLMWSVFKSVQYIIVNSIVGKMYVEANDRKALMGDQHWGNTWCPWHHYVANILKLSD